MFATLLTQVCKSLKTFHTSWSIFKNTVALFSRQLNKMVSNQPSHPFFVPFQLETVSERAMMQSLDIIESYCSLEIDWWSDNVQLC